MSTDAPAKLSYSDISDWVWNEFRTGVHLDAAQITSGVFAVDRVPGLPASKIISGEINANRVPGLPASKITSGEIHVDRIPQLDAATKIIGVLPISLGGTGGTTAASARLNLGVPLPTTETPEAPTKEGSVGNLSMIFARGDHSHPEQTTIAYVAAPSTQATDTLPIALESPTYPGSESSYSGFYSPAHSTIVMRAGADSYKFEYNKVTLGEDVDFIGRNDDADINDPKPLYISGASATTKGGTIALGGSNYPSLSLRVDNKSYLYLSEGAAFPVTIGDNTYVHGNLETSGYVSADALYGNSAQAERMTLTPIARSSLPVSMPSSGVMYFDYDDSKFYGRVNNSWQILNSSNSDFTLAGLSEKSYNSLTDKPTIPTNSSFTLADLSEKSYNSLTDKPTIPTNSSFTLAGLGEKDFSSLTNKPTTLAGYGITDAVGGSDLTSHTHGNITNAGAIGTTSGLVVTTTTGGVLTTSNRSGIDSRSTFPPASHTHEYVSKTGDTMTGALTIGTDTSTNGSTMVQSRYPNGAPNLLGTMRSSGGTMLGYGLRPSNTVANGFESSVGVALSRSAMTLESGIKFFTAPSSTTAIGTAITPSEVFSISNNGAVSIPQTLSVTNGITGNLTGTASKATADASGNTITATYATKSDNPRKFLVTPLRNKTYRIGSITGGYNGITLYCGNAANYDNYSEITWLIESQTGTITEVFNACAPLNPAFKKRLHTYKDASNKVWIYLVCPNYNDLASLYLDNSITSPSFNISILDVTDTWATEIADKTLLDSNPTSIGGKGITSNGFFGNLTGNVTGNVTGNLTGNADTANVANALDNTVDVGNATTPVYFKDGLPMTISYTIAKSVPSNAVFTDTTYSNMVGATTSVAGTAGLVPAPSAGAATRYLRSDGTWQVPPDTNTTYSANNGVSLTGTTFSNSGVRSITTGGTNGTISVNTNGTSANVAVKGLGTAAYTASTDYATSGHTHNYAGSSSAGGSATTAEKVNGALTITLNGGSTEGTDKFTFDGSVSKTIDIVAKKIQAFKYMTASETVYVGASETYKTINSALEYLSTRYPIYKSGGIIATIILRSEFIMKEQVIVNGLDFGWVRIASEDAEVVIDESYVTAPVPGDWYATQYAAFTVVNGGVLPIISALFKYGSQSSGTACGIISRSSTVIIEPSCGIKNAKSTGIIAINSTVYGKDSIFSGANGDCGYFSGCTKAFMAGAILSGSVTGSGLTAENAATVSAAIADCSNCGNYSILANRGSLVVANSATLSGSYLGIYASYCSTVNADSSVITGITSDNCLYASQSSTINVAAASLSKAVVSDRGSNVNITGTTGATLAQVLFGGFISAYNTSVTLSQPANTITGHGIIFK